MDPSLLPPSWLVFVALVPIVWAFVHGVRKWIPAIDGVWVLLVVACVALGMIFATEFEARRWYAMIAHWIVLFVLSVGLSEGLRREPKSTPSPPPPS